MNETTSEELNYFEYIDRRKPSYDKSIYSSSSGGDGSDGYDRVLNSTDFPMNARKSNRGSHRNKTSGHGYVPQMNSSITSDMLKQYRNKLILNVNARETIGLDGIDGKSGGKLSFSDENDKLYEIKDLDGTKTSENDTNKKEVERPSKRHKTGHLWSTQFSERAVRIPLNKAVSSPNNNNNVKTNTTNTNSNTTYNSFNTSHPIPLHAQHQQRQPIEYISYPKEHILHDNIFVGQDRDERYVQDEDKTKLNIPFVDMHRKTNQRSSTNNSFSTVYGVSFCDCLCDGCDIHNDVFLDIHKQTNNSHQMEHQNKKGMCYYKEEHTKIEYCSKDPRWDKLDHHLTNEIISELNFVESTLVSERQKVSIGSILGKLASTKFMEPYIVALFHIPLDLNLKDKAQDQYCYTKSQNVSSNPISDDRLVQANKTYEDKMKHIENNITKKVCFNKSHNNKIHNSELHKKENYSTGNTSLFHAKGGLGGTNANNNSSNNTQKYNYTRCCVIIDSKCHSDDRYLIRTCLNRNTVYIDGPGDVSLVRLIRNFNVGKSKDSVSPSEDTNSPTFYNIKALKSSGSQQSQVWVSMENIEMWTYIRSFIVLCPDA